MQLLYLCHSESAAYGGFGTSLRALMEMADRQGEELSRAMVELAVSDESVLGRLQSGNKDIYHLGFTGGVKESAECKSEFQKAQKRFAHAFRKLERAIRAYWVAAKKADVATITHETLRNQHADNSKAPALSTPLLLFRALLCSFTSFTLTHKHNPCALECTQYCTSTCTVYALRVYIRTCVI